MPLNCGPAKQLKAPSFLCFSGVPWERMLKFAMQTQDKCLAQDIQRGGGMSLKDSIGVIWCLNQESVVLLFLQLGLRSHL